MASLALVDPDVKRDEFFYFDIVVFRAENTLFRVPRYGLPSDGAAFDAMFSREQGGPGSHDTDPIILDSDVTATDFRSLLKAAYPPPGTTNVALTVDEWMSVLKLSNKWKLTSMKEKAISESDSRVAEMAVVDKIILAKKYGISKWLKEGYRALALRAESVTTDEIDKLGWETYGRVMDIREKSFVWLTSLTSTPTNNGSKPYCSYCGCYHMVGCQNTGAQPTSYNRANFDYDTAIRDVFSNELDK